MEVRLISWTKNADELAVKSARYCRTDKKYNEIKLEDPKRLLHSIMKLGHFSVLEHASFTLEITGISRTASHQLIRHRVASFSQQSQRTVRFKEPSYVIPPSIIKKEGEIKEIFDKTIQDSFSSYGKLLKLGVKAEDARFVLPQAVTTNLVMTMNCRELLHFFKLRLAKDAQWEIRELAKEMLSLVIEKAPLIFSYANEEDIIE
ncbi:MAG: FAD-dependent thymidylate synthase [Candidatus Ranarchaeia archaeon]